MKKLAWVLAVLLLLIVTPLIFLKSNLFTIKDISCKTQYGPCDKEDTTKLLGFSGQNLFSASSREVVKKMKGDFQNRNVYVQKIFPKTLIVILDKRKPFVLLRKDGPEVQGFLVDRDGVVIGLVEKSSLPSLIVWGDVNLVVGRGVAEKVKKAAEILFITNRTQKVQVGEYKNEKDDFFTVDLPNNGKVYFPLDKDPEVLIGALQLIVTRSRIDGKMPESIDLRYSNPVLRY